MARVKRSVNGKKHRRAVLESARGYTGARSRHFKAANEQVMHSLRYAYRDRRARKGEIRRVWIVRINAACREHDISYSRFIAGPKAAEVEADRKILRGGARACGSWSGGVSGGWGPGEVEVDRKIRADLAVREPATFGALVDTARE